MTLAGTIGRRKEKEETEGKIVYEYREVPNTAEKNGRVCLRRKEGGRALLRDSSTEEQLCKEG